MSAPTPTASASPPPSCSILQEALFKVQQDASAAKAISQKLGVNPIASCTTWSGNVADAAAKTASLYSYDVRRAAIEDQMMQGICSVSGATIGDCTPSQVIVRDTTGAQNVENRALEALRNMRAGSLISARHLTPKNRVLEGLCDSYLRFDHPEEHFDVTLCATKQPPSATFLNTDVANKICNNYKGAFVPMISQTAKDPDDPSPYYYHAFVCLGADEMSSEEYVDSVNKMLDMLKTSDSAEAISNDATHGGKVLIGDACPCVIAQQMGPLICAKIGNLAKDTKADGSDTDAVAQLGMPVDDDFQKNLELLQNLKCDTFGAVNVQQANTACASFCSRPGPKVNNVACNDCAKYILRSGAAVALGEMMMGPAGAPAAATALERAIYQTKAFCDLCYKREHAHGLARIGMDIVSYGFEYLMDATGGMMALTCGDCPKAKTCMDHLTGKKVLDPKAWGCEFNWS